MPPFPDLAPPALVIDKPVSSAFAGHLLRDELMQSHSDTLILTETETDVYVLSTEHIEVPDTQTIVTASGVV